MCQMSNELEITCKQCRFIHDQSICPQCGLPDKVGARKQLTASVEVLSSYPIAKAGPVELVGASIGTGRSMWHDSVKGMMQILAELQAKTHVVKYCKEFHLPAIWESAETDAFADMRWFNRVVTGLEYNWIIEPDEPRAAGFIPRTLIESKERVYDIINRVLEINMYLPANHIYSIYVVVNTVNYAEPNKHATFSLEKILKSKLKDFSRKAIVMRYRGRGSQATQPIIRVQK